VCLWHHGEMDLWALSDLCTPWCVHVVATLGGRGRTLEELREMAREASLEVKAVGRQAPGRVIVECRPG
jgi:hypothetical protein